MQDNHDQIYVRQSVVKRSFQTNFKIRIKLISQFKSNFITPSNFIIIIK